MAQSGFVNLTDQEQDQIQNRQRVGFTIEDIKNDNSRGSGLLSGKVFILALAGIIALPYVLRSGIFKSNKKTMRRKRK